MAHRASDHEKAGRQRDTSASALTWYWHRLRCMSPSEIGYRVCQQLVSRLQQFGLRTTRTTLKPDLSVSMSDFVSPAAGISAQPYTNAADEILHGRLRIFARAYVFETSPQWNQDPKTGTVAPLSFGKRLDYRDQTVVGDIKYLWEPNRHLHLVTLAQAYHLTGDRRYLEGLRHQLESWLDQCPYLKGPNWTSSLELAIRLINWSIAWQLVGKLESPLFSDSDGKLFRDRWLSSIYQHMHFIRGHLSRFSSANNHQIGRAHV